MKNTEKRYRDSIKILKLRRKELIDAKTAYKHSKQYHDAPAFVENIKNKVSELKEKKHIWNEIIKQWDNVAKIFKEADNAMLKIDDAIDGYDKKKLFQSASQVISYMKQIQQLSQQLKEVPGNFTMIQT